MENAVYLFAAFTLIWVVFFGYLLLQAGRQRKLHREIESLRERLREKVDD